ncbi:MAG: addiction module toxin, HicA family [SAR202 cluster bacterium]|nr:addiction module toxin, HicA family [SAR202 cluster bacterium]
MGRNVTGKQMIRILEKDGWTRGGQRTHGIFFHKRYPGESLPRTVIVPDKNSVLPTGTLGAILGVKQTKLGKDGLEEVIEKYGLK